MTDFMDQFVERQGIETTRKLVHRHGFKAVLAVMFIREGGAETLRLLREDTGIDPARITDTATEERLLKRLDAEWIAARASSEPHKVRGALATLVLDLLLALQELYKSRGTLESVLGEGRAARVTVETKTAASSEPERTLDLIAV